MGDPSAPALVSKAHCCLQPAMILRMFAHASVADCERARSSHAKAVMRTAPMQMPVTSVTVDFFDMRVRMLAMTKVSDRRRQEQWRVNGMPELLLTVERRSVAAFRSTDFC